eukprot:364902-Chlamydomonas_euryale.AAC.15
MPRRHSPTSSCAAAVTSTAPPDFIDTPGRPRRRGRTESDAPFRCLRDLDFADRPRPLASHSPCINSLPAQTQRRRGGERAHGMGGRAKVLETTQGAQDDRGSLSRRARRLLQRGRGEPHMRKA